MGLDYHVWCRKNDESADVFSGCGRAAFKFLSTWVGSERYGDDIPLTEENIKTLIKLALDYAKDYLSEEELDYRAINDSSDSFFVNDPLSFACYLKHVQTYLELLGDKAPKYFIECDW